MRCGPARPSTRSNGQASPTHSKAKFWGTRQNSQHISQRHVPGDAAPRPPPEGSAQECRGSCRNIIRVFLGATTWTLEPLRLKPSGGSSGSTEGASLEVVPTETVLLAAELVFDFNDALARMSSKKRSPWDRRCIARCSRCLAPGVGREASPDGSRPGGAVQ